MSIVNPIIGGLAMLGLAFVAASGDHVAQLVFLSTVAIVYLFPYPTKP